MNFQDEYLSFVARLIIHINEMGNKNNMMHQQQAALNQAQQQQQQQQLNVQQQQQNQQGQVGKFKKTTFLNQLGG